MRIETKNGYVDFEAPIQMTETQREKFISFMRENFDDVEVEQVEEKYKEMGERKSTSKEWTPDEFLLLLTPKSNEDVSAMTDRSMMSIKMMRGHFVADFMVWAKKKGYSLPVGVEVIEDYLKETSKK